MNHGYEFVDDEVVMNVWAPKIKDMIVLRVKDGAKFPMNGSSGGFKSANVRLPPGERYYFLADGQRIPDPASRFQPDGISGPSEIIKNDYEGVKKWKTYDLKDAIIEEIHIGTFTKEGTYESAEKMVDHFVNLGINHIELMPLNQTYGTRNWGYDGVFIFAPSYSYGRPENLRRFIDTLHENNINVILDVVYNHIGPFGNILGILGDYFSKSYINPWGQALNFDGPGSDAVRSFILQNIKYWIEEYKFDGLRIDATHAIFDSSPVHILKEISTTIKSLEHKLGRKIKLIAEDDKNDSAIVDRLEDCGYGFDASWNGDFHHSVHSYLTSENRGYYEDYGNFTDIIDCLKNGYLYNGKYSKYLRKTRGTVFAGSRRKLVVFDSNHDQVGNRAFGERPVSLVGDLKARLFAAIVLLSPFTPMLFMGEEYGETNPFLFFIQTEDNEFANIVRNGRMNEFKDFSWNGNIPDPSSIESFDKSKLSWKLTDNRGKQFIEFYKKMINLRKRIVSDKYSVSSENNVIRIDYEKASVYISFSDKQQIIKQGPKGTRDETAIDPFSILVQDT